jgi:hypothetical protein
VPQPRFCQAQDLWQGIKRILQPAAQTQGRRLSYQLVVVMQNY